MQCGIADLDVSIGFKRNVSIPEVFRGVDSSRFLTPGFFLYSNGFYQMVRANDDK